MMLDDNRAKEEIGSIVVDGDSTVDLQRRRRTNGTSSEAGT